MMFRMQRRVRGGRQQVSSCVVRELRRAVRDEAKRYGVSQSFVIAVAIGDALGVDVESYRPQPARLRRVK